ncbi:MAG: hypothetical protein V4484_24085 [Pseudomonadota bacterium]
MLVGANLAPLVSGEKTVFMERIAAIRKQYALDSGMILPRLRFRDTPPDRRERLRAAGFGVA